MARRGRPAKQHVAGSVEGIGGTENEIGNTVVNPADNAIRDDAGAIIIDPAAVTEPGSGSTSDNSTGDAPKRRGRKPGSRNSAKAAGSLDVNGVEAILFSTHQLLASLAQTPEMAIDKMEANTLAIGIANVARHYDMGATQKSLDWANLISVVGMVYGTRIYAIRARVAQEKAKNAGNGLERPIHTIPTGA